MIYDLVIKNWLTFVCQLKTRAAILDERNINDMIAKLMAWLFVKIKLDILAVNATRRRESC